MALTQLNKDTFTAVTIAADSILQVKAGIAEIAGSASPAANDWLTIAPGDTVALSSTVYARGTGYVVVLGQ